MPDRIHFTVYCGSIRETSARSFVDHISRDTDAKVRRKLLSRLSHKVSLPSREPMRRIRCLSRYRHDALQMLNLNVTQGESWSLPEPFAPEGTAALIEFLADC